MSVNFGSLREAQRKERETPNTLQPMPSNFYEELSGYFSEKNRAVTEAKGREGDFGNAVAEQHEKELENARSAFKDLFERRLRKISLLALEAADEDGATSMAVDTTAMTSAEREMFDGLFRHFREGRQAILSAVFAAPPGRAEGTLKKAQTATIMVRVRLTSDVPSFVGSDMASYGPYPKGAVAGLPERNARLLVEKGRAVVEEDDEPQKEK